MPTYLYECLGKGAHGEFEEEHSLKIKLEECPHCKEAGLGAQPVRRLISPSTCGKVELTGNELKEHIKTDAKRIQREAAQNESKYANLLGNDKYHALQTKLDRRGR